MPAPFVKRRQLRNSATPVAPVVVPVKVVEEVLEVKEVVVPEVKVPKKKVSKKSVRKDN
jgi:hypothetical protein